MVSTLIKLADTLINFLYLRFKSNVFSMEGNFIWVRIKYLRYRVANVLDIQRDLVPSILDFHICHVHLVSTFFLIEFRPFSGFSDWFGRRRMGLLGT